MTKAWMALGLCAMLAACAPAPQPSAAQQAETAACTAQGDAIYHADTIDEEGRTAQNGLLYGGTPTHVFDAEHLGALHARDSAVSQCEQNGESGTPALGGGNIVPPQVTGTP